jgi:hypothetical protein
MQSVGTGDFMRYFEEAENLWKTYVPKTGQADTVQGELIRAVEKLRDEAQHNGNINWDEGHEVLAQFILATLSDSGLFESNTLKQIEADIVQIRNYETPNTEDDIYDRLTDHIVEWSRQQKEPIPHTKNPKLKR